MQTATFEQPTEFKPAGIKVIGAEHNNDGSGGILVTLEGEYNRLDSMDARNLALETARKYGVGTPAISSIGANVYAVTADGQTIPPEQTAMPPGGKFRAKIAVTGVA